MGSARIGFLGTAILLLSACGNSSGMAPGAKAEEEGPFEPTLAAIQENVFTPICTECHTGNVPSGGLSLGDVQTSYDNLVDIDSRQAGDLKRVSPGDPGSSYLIHKLEGTQDSGAQMPKGQPPLDQESIDVIRQWISDGAEPESPPAEDT